MMAGSIVAVGMAVFWSGILIGIIYCMRKKNLFVKSFGIGSIVSLYLFCLLRMFLPFNFTFTKGMQMRGLFSDIFYALYLDKRQIGNYYVTLLDGLILLWIVVALFLFGKFLYEYCKTCRMLQKAGEEESQSMEVMRKVYELKGKRREVVVLRSKEVNMPMGMGIWKRRIVLPKQEYKDEELYYILLHEYTHFINGDLLIKFMVQAFCCIFWWNPILYLLVKDLDQSLEIKCDLCITEKLSSIETSEYLQTIVATLKAAGERKRRIGFNGTVALGKGKRNELLERFEYVLKNQKSKDQGRKAIVVWIVAVCAVWFASYAVVPLPSYEAPIEENITEPGTVEMTPENTYVIYENGIYKIFVNGKLDGTCKKKYADLLEKSGFEIVRQ